MVIDGYYLTLSWTKQTEKFMRQMEEFKHDWLSNDIKKPLWGFWV